MSIDEYFKIVSTEGNLLHIELKNFWSDDIVDEIGPEFLKLFKQAVDSYNNSKFIIINDTSQMKAPTQKAREYLIEAVNYGLEHGLYKAVQVVPDTVYEVAEKMAAKKKQEHESMIVAPNLIEAFKIVGRIKVELD